MEQQSDEKVQRTPDGRQVQLAPRRLQTRPSRGSLTQFFVQQSDEKVQRCPAGLQVHDEPRVLQTRPTRGVLTQLREQQSDENVQREPFGAQLITIGAFFGVAKAAGIESADRRMSNANVRIETPLRWGAYHKTRDGMQMNIGDLLGRINPQSARPRLEPMADDRRWAQRASMGIA